jgi:hypothetical protein
VTCLSVPARGVRARDGRVAIPCCLRENRDWCVPVLCAGAVCWCWVLVLCAGAVCWCWVLVLMVMVPQASNVGELQDWVRHLLGLA